MIATSVSVSVFLTVLVIAVAFIVWYRMKVKFRKPEITQGEVTVDQPTATNNLTDGLELDTMNAQTRTNLDTLQSEGSASSEDNGLGPREGEV